MVFQKALQLRNEEYRQLLTQKKKLDAEWRDTAARTRDLKKEIQQLKACTQSLPYNVIVLTSGALVAPLCAVPKDEVFNTAQACTGNRGGIIATGMRIAR